MLFETRKDFELQIRRYCAQAERCTQDVIRKLTEWNVQEENMLLTLEALRKEKYLDDTRYADNYVADKWKLSGWGKIKIRHGLLEKEIDESLVEQSLEKLDMQDYQTRFFEIMDKKYLEIKKEEPEKHISRMTSFAASRGFEEGWIMAWLEARKIEFDKF